MSGFSRWWRQLIGVDMRQKTAAREVLEHTSTEVSIARDEFYHQLRRLQHHMRRAEVKDERHTDDAS